MTIKIVISFVNGHNKLRAITFWLCSRISIEASVCANKDNISVLLGLSNITRNTTHAY